MGQIEPVTERPFENLTILLLEDEALIALDVEQLMLDHGAADVRVVREAGALLEPTALGHFDAAIVDVMLGSDPTTGFAQYLIENRIPFIFATGHSGSEDLFAEFSGIPIVGKPFFGSDLVESLAERMRAVSTPESRN